MNQRNDFERITDPKHNNSLPKSYIKQLASMKRILVCAMMLAASRVAVGQTDRYQQAMKQTLALIDTAESVPTNLAAAGTFQRIAQAEKTKWMPYYYASLCQVTAAFDADPTRIDELCDQATANILKADSLSPNNSEIYCLRSMIPIAQLSVDFMKRGGTNLELSREFLKKAYQLDANNPRVYFLQGQHLYNTPGMFGGDKNKAKEYFLKARSLFEATPKTDQAIDIHWGRKSTEQRLASYK